MSDVIHDADNYAWAIERATEAMDPPIEVYTGILKLIAAFTIGDDDWSHYDRECFTFDGWRITRRSTPAEMRWRSVYTEYAPEWRWRSAFGTKTVSSGRHSWRVRIEKRLGFMTIGISRTRDRIDTWCQKHDGYTYNAVRTQPIDSTANSQVKCNSVAPSPQAFSVF